MLWRARVLGNDRTKTGEEANRFRFLFHTRERFADMMEVSPMLEAFPGNAEAWIKRAGIHSTWPPPKDREQRLYFALLEALGWDCWNLGGQKHMPDSLTEREVRDWLKVWADKIEADACPDFLALMAGTYDFLREEPNG